MPEKQPEYPNSHPPPPTPTYTQVHGLEGQTCNPSWLEAEAGTSVRPAQAA